MGVQSEELYAKAKELMPGGVNSPVRAFRAVGGTPIYFKSARGPSLFDVDGNEYIDYVSSWGAIILGHANGGVNRAIAEAAINGTSFGAPHEGEIKLAQEVIRPNACRGAGSFCELGDGSCVGRHPFGPRRDRTKQDYQV